MDQLAELGLAAKLLLALGPILFLIALIFSMRAREFSWPNIAVLGIAIMALLLPSVQRFSLSKDSVSFEQFQNGVATSRDAIAELHKNSEENARAIAALRDSLAEMKTSYTNLIAKQNDALAAVAEKAPASPGMPPADSGHLEQVQRDLKRTSDGINSKLDQADRAINSFNANNDVAQRKIRDIDAAIRQKF